MTYLFIGYALITGKSLSSPGSMLRLFTHTQINFISLGVLGGLQAMLCSQWYFLHPSKSLDQLLHNQSYQNQTLYE